jgi:hypothetical protein
MTRNALQYRRGEFVCSAILRFWRQGCIPPFDATGPGVIAENSACVPNTIKSIFMFNSILGESCFAFKTATRRGHFGDLADWSGPALEA